MSHIVIVGGGAAGMLCAYRAGQKGHQVTLLERNDRVGKKLFITGKGRCNITNDAPIEDFFVQVPRNAKFLYSAFDAYTNRDIVDLIESYGIKTKVERGGRVFPESDKSNDVIRALMHVLQDANVSIRYQARVKEIIHNDDKVGGVQLTDGSMIEADAVVLATGGASYPQTGSSGDGYKMARECRHTVTDIVPSLVPLVTEEKWVPELQGLSLRNVTLTAFEKNGKKKVFSDQGEMIFTHFGVSGPLVLSCSSHLRMKNNPTLLLDLKPALDEQKLDARIRREIDSSGRRCYGNLLTTLLPSKMIPVFIKLSGIDRDKHSSDLTKQDRLTMIELLKRLPMTVKGFRSIEEAIITRGGVSLKEVNPSTMESKKIAGLYIIGELLDLDAYTGGYNLQIAWSTGYLAGNSIL